MVESKYGLCLPVINRANQYGRVLLTALLFDKYDVQFIQLNPVRNTKTHKEINYVARTLLNACS